MSGLKRTITVEEYSGDATDLRNVLDSLPRRIRGRMDIMADVIEACTNGVLRTNIMYRANLSHEQLLIYLGKAKERGLIREDVGSGKYGETRYFATEDGRKYLTLLRSAQRMMYMPLTAQG